MSEQAVAKHERATVLDRRFQLLDWSLDLPSGRSDKPEEIALAREMVLRRRRLDRAAFR